MWCLSSLAATHFRTELLELYEHKCRPAHWIYLKQKEYIYRVIFLILLSPFWQITFIYELCFVGTSSMSNWSNKNTGYFQTVKLFLSFSLLIGWQLSIWNCWKPFFSLLYNCQLLCFWRLALNIVVEAIFSGYCFFKDVHYKLVMPKCMPYRWMAYIFLRFLKVSFLLSQFEKLHHSLFHPSILFLKFLSSFMFQMQLRTSLHFFLRSVFLIHKQKHSKYNFL
jgi:hypothetical protein